MIKTEVCSASADNTDTRFWYIAQNAIVFRDMYLQFSNYLRTALQFACLELVGCDWWTNLALGIHESLRGFQLLSIQGLNSQSKSQSAEISLFDLKSLEAPVSKNIFWIIEIVSRTRGGLKSLTCNKGVFIFQVRNSPWFGRLENTKQNKTADNNNKRAYLWSDEFFCDHLLIKVLSEQLHVHVENTGPNLEYH